MAIGIAFATITACGDSEDTTTTQPGAQASAIRQPEVRRLRGAIALVSGKGSGYYGCTNASRKSCDNKVLISRKRLGGAGQDAVVRRGEPRGGQGTRLHTAAEGMDRELRGGADRPA